MPAFTFKYNQPISLDYIPAVGYADFRLAILELVRENWRIIALFALPLTQNAKRAALCCIMAKDDFLCIFRTQELSEFESLAKECPQIQLFEREIFENNGIMPKNHPWLKPVRKISDYPFINTGEYGFYSIQGENVHEVGVGPVHAGIIEPGHFRFQCFGETVLNLEIALGYQHRGVEKTLLNLPAHTTLNQRRLRIVECIAGDASIAHATAQCVLWERMLGDKIEPVSAYNQRLRRIGLELERLACHCGDLGAIAGDTGFLPTAAWNGRIRGDFLNLTAFICGNRFGREFVKLGGTNCNLSALDCKQMLERLKDAGRDAIGSCEVMFGNATVRDRLIDTGTVKKQIAMEAGLVGVAARASGIPLDARFQTPLSDLPFYNTVIRTDSAGDVMSRAAVRFLELKDSLELVQNDLEWIMENENAMRKQGELKHKLPPNMLGVAQTESWRGEVCHIGVTGSDGNFLVCKFIDPSFHNWTGLSLAMRNEQISDFPLCNKSFNLSYCGNDL